ncbi:MAG: 3-phosphoshikimate 1-carboxyvinyltransferase [Clostridiales bacterium]
MIMKIKSSKVSGEIAIPGSKSHTIRAVVIASLAEGVSKIRKPLISEDALSAVETCRSFGAKIKTETDFFEVQGFGKNPKTPDNIIDVRNSGTTLRITLMVAALIDGMTVFTGDDSVRKRPLEPLIKAMNNLGAKVYSTKNNGKAPVIVSGKIIGGKTDLDAVTSQYLSSLLISLPLIENNTEIVIKRLNEVPYVEMTLWWMNKQNIKYENYDFKKFLIYGGQKYRHFDEFVTGDFSSATFILIYGAISKNKIILKNLNMEDAQGDKRVIGILKEMGANIYIEEDKIIIDGGEIKGMDIDMNSIPDALPAFAVLGCFADGITRLLNVPQARLKETDRISVMHNELRKMGAEIEELKDGLIIKQSILKGCQVNGHYDHRIVMALAVAGMNIDGLTTVDTSEAINVTFPTFVKDMKKCGADISIEE